MHQKLLKIALVGKTNAGKSTLLNKIIGETVSIINKKINTTQELIKKHGPSHSPTFTVSLKVLNLKLIKASGSSIREAEKNAALVAIEMFNASKTS